MEEIKFKNLSIPLRASLIVGALAIAYNTYHIEMLYNLIDEILIITGGLLDLTNDIMGAILREHIW